MRLVKVVIIIFTMDINVSYSVLIILRFSSQGNMFYELAMPSKQTKTAGLTKVLKKQISNYVYGGIKKTNVLIWCAKQCQ